MRDVYIARPRASSLIVEKVSEREMVTMWQPHEWRQCQARTNECLLLKHPYIHRIKTCLCVGVSWVSTTKAIIITKMRGRNSFLQTLYYFRILSIYGSQHQRFDGSCFDFRTFSLLNIFFVHLKSCARSRTHTHPRTFSLDFFTVYLPFSVLIFHFKLVVRGS